MLVSGKHTGKRHLSGIFPVNPSFGRLPPSRKTAASYVRGLPGKLFWAEVSH